MYVYTSVADENMKALCSTLDPLCSPFDGWDIGQVALDKDRSAIGVVSKEYLVLLAPFIQRIDVFVFVAAQDKHSVYFVEEQLGRDICVHLYKRVSI